MMTDKEAIKDYKEGVVAFFVVLIIVGVSILFITFTAMSESPQNGTQFEVVDKYKQCDVVRYTDPSQRYRYFLHCPKAP